MRAAMLFILAVAGVASTIAHANPIADLFTARSSERSTPGDCSVLAARLGPQAAWYGEYAGTRFNAWSENYSTYAARGCFESQFACRRWQNETISWTEGRITYTFCRQGVPQRYLR